MKYKKLRLTLNYENYTEEVKNYLSSYTKNKVYYSMGDFIIYVDSDNVEYGRNKLIKAANKKLEETLKQIK